MKLQPEFVLAGVRIKMLLSSEQTRGSLSLFENGSGGASRTPIHVHTSEDETLYLIEGEMQAIIAEPRAGERINLRIAARWWPHPGIGRSSSASFRCRYRTHE